MSVIKPGYLALYVLGGVILLIIAVLAYRAFRVFTSIPRYEKYWQERAAEPVNKGDFQIVAIGDSTMQAIGASRPEDGVVGRAERLVRERTGKNVHVFNVSVSGAKVAEAVENQLPKITDIKPDLVLVSVGANDSIKKTNLDEYKKSYQQLIKAMPSDITVFANTPDVDNRNQYQKIFRELAVENNLKVAEVFEYVHPHRYDPRVYGGDFFHPSSKGYGYWFDAFEPQILAILNR